MSKFKEMKFRVKSPGHSKKIQEALFDLGYKWSGDIEPILSSVEKPYLYTDEDGEICYDEIRAIAFFDDYEATETTLEELELLVAAKKATTDHASGYFDEPKNTDDDLVEKFIRFEVLKEVLRSRRDAPLCEVLKYSREMVEFVSNG